MVNTISVMPPSWPGSGFINFFMRKDKNAKEQVLIRENRKTFLIIAQVPGFIKDDISIRFQDQTLTIYASCYSLLGQQTPFKRNFYRSIHIAKAIEVEQITSLYENNVLKIWLPKKPQSFVVSSKEGLKGKLRSWFPLK